jgi:hypothetical protein
LHALKEIVDQNKKCLAIQEESLKLDISRAEENKTTKRANYMDLAAKALDDEAPLKKQKLINQLEIQELERERATTQNFSD